MSDVKAKIAEVADSLRKAEIDIDEAGYITDSVRSDLQRTGVLQMMQSKTYGGLESHPAEFAEAVMDIARLNPSAGWVAGVVGVHPWQISGFARQLQDEIWKDDPKVIVSSPYAPAGVLKPVDGGYRLTGRVTFSSGGEICTWAIIGALREVPAGPPEVMHVVLPREDYTFDQESWHVLGLRGTGSKDLVVEDAFIPEYRVYDPAGFDNGQYFAEVGEHADLYKLPFATIFSAAINAASAGIIENSMDKVIANYTERIDVRGIKSVDDPYQLIQLAEAAADVSAARIVVLNDARRIYDEVVANGKLSAQTRAEVRANGVRAIRRAVDAIDRVYHFAGGRSLQNSNAVQAALRNAKAVSAHLCNAQHPIYEVAAKVTLGMDTSDSKALW